MLEHREISSCKDDGGRGNTAADCHRHHLATSHYALQSDASKGLTAVRNGDCSVYGPVEWGFRHQGEASPRCWRTNTVVVVPSLLARTELFRNWKSGNEISRGDVNGQRCYRRGGHGTGTTKSIMQTEISDWALSAKGFSLLPWSSTPTQRGMKVNILRTLVYYVVGFPSGGQITRHALGRAGVSIVP